MRSSHHRVLLVLSVLCFGIFSSLAAAQSSNLSHQAWTTENGLPQNSVHAIFQSRDGYLWIATEGGVARSNAVEFRIFQHDNTPAITSDDICCFAQGAEDSTVWIGTADGIVRYSDGAFQHYGTAEGLPSSSILSLASVNGSIFALTPAGLVHFDGNRFVAVPTSSSITAISISGDSLLIATATGLFQYRGNTLSRAYQQLMPSSQPVRAFGYLPDHSLWQRTSTELTFIANGNPRTIGPSTLNGAHIQSFLPSLQGGIWIGTNHGLYRLDSTISAPRLQPDLDTHSILSLQEDAEGDLWVGTESSGLHVLRHRNFHTLPGDTESMATSITQTTDGAVWVGTNGEGLERWLSGNKRNVSTRDGLLSDVILSLAPGPAEDLWIGTPDGLNHLQGGRITAITSADGLPDDFVRSLYPDRDGTLWIGTRRGLAHLDNGKITTLTQTDGLGSDLVGALVRPAGSNNLWIATLNGLSVRDGHGNIKTYTQKDGLSGNTITALFTDTQGNLWIGTRGNGLSVRTADGRFLAIHRDDLPATIDTILGDNRGALWLGSAHGILRVRLYEMIACASSPSCTLHINRYGASDGMPTEEVSSMGHPAVWKTAEGTLWFATRKGVAIVDPANLFINRIPPPVVLERFTIDDVEQPGNIDVSPGHSRFAFQYAALSFVAPSRVQYRYRLEGFDQHWIDAGSRRTAFYTNLPAGRYRFIVQAANNDGVWNERGAVIAFSVQPPFYRTLWFILLVIVLLALAVFLIYRLRLRRLRSQFNAVLAERNRVAREVHDTLAQSFVGVSVQLELAGQLLAHEKVDAARQQLDQTRAYVREGIDEARRSIWDLRAATAQNTLPTRLSRLAEKTEGHLLRIQVQIGGTYRPLPASIENEVFRIAQEALANVSQHAQATSASLSLNYEPSQLTLSVVDNGRGFSPTVPKNSSRGHFGIQGMRERTLTIGADLTITSSPGRGTQVRLVVPLPGQKG
jgi:signal transduction histidine kinase/ligand-binding sensor domain-containing protein